MGNWEEEECIHVPGMKARNCGMCLMDLEPPAPTPSAAQADPSEVDYGPFQTKYDGTCKACGFSYVKGDMVYKLVAPGCIHDRCCPEPEF